MNHLALAAKVIVFSVLCSISWAAMPTNPVTDPNFSILPNGVKLSQIKVSGSPLYLTRGVGTRYTATTQSRYQNIKEQSQRTRGYKTQWALMDLDANRVLAESLESNRKIFGASASKIFVGGGLLNKQEGELSSSQLQLMANMLVVSSNTAWTDLQRQIGDGNSNKGRQRIADFTAGLGLERTRGYQGYLGSLHGNELTAAETVEYLQYVYKGDFPGAETLWKVMHTCRTCVNRGYKYMPTDIFFGGKTGTYQGPTVDPETGADINVNICNQILVFNVEGRQYGLAILSNSGSSEDVAALAAGLFYEYTGYKVP